MQKYTHNCLLGKELASNGADVIFYSFQNPLKSEVFSSIPG
jgi:hypothetical protein